MMTKVTGDITLVIGHEANHLTRFSHVMLTAVARDSVLLFRDKEPTPHEVRSLWKDPQLGCD